MADRGAGVEGWAPRLSESGAPLARRGSIEPSPVRGPRPASRRAACVSIGTDAAPLTLPPSAGHGGKANGALCPDHSSGPLAVPAAPDRGLGRVRPHHAAPHPMPRHTGMLRRYVRSTLTVARCCAASHSGNGARSAGYGSTLPHEPRRSSGRRNRTPLDTQWTGEGQHTAPHRTPNGEHRTNRRQDSKRAASEAHSQALTASRIGTALTQARADRSHTLPADPSSRRAAVSQGPPSGDRIPPGFQTPQLAPRAGPTRSACSLPPKNRVFQPGVWVLPVPRARRLALVLASKGRKVRASTCVHPRRGL